MSKSNHSKPASHIFKSTLTFLQYSRKYPSWMSLHPLILTFSRCIHVSSLPNSVWERPPLEITNPQRWEDNHNHRMSAQGGYTLRCWSPSRVGDSSEGQWELGVNPIWKVMGWWVLWGAPPSPLWSECCPAQGAHNLHSLQLSLSSAPWKLAPICADSFLPCQVRKVSYFQINFGSSSGSLLPDPPSHTHKRLTTNTRIHCSIAFEKLVNWLDWIISKSIEYHGQDRGLKLRTAWLHNSSSATYFSCDLGHIVSLI